MVDTSKTTRRTALGLIGTGAILTATDTLGFSQVTGTRGVSLNTTTDPEALIGLLVNDQVKKNQQEHLVTVSNTTDEVLDVTVSLSDCAQGTLTGPYGATDCTVGFELRPSGTDGDSKTVDITSDADGETIPFTITAMSSSLSFDATRSTDVVTGNTESAVEIAKLQDFQASADDDRWTVKWIKVESNDAARELTRVEYEITDGAGNTVRLYEENASGDVYERKHDGNNPGLVIEPEDGDTLTADEEYTLTVVAYDDAGNFARTSRSAVT